VIAGIITAVTGVVGKVLPEIIEDPDERNRIEAKLTTKLWEHRAELQQQAGEIVKTEVGGRGLKAWWRPITALTFVALIVARWLGFTVEGIDPALEAELMELVKVMIGGYVGSRGIEKVAPHVADAMKNRRGRDG
jgi:hypothetical protein